MHAVPPARLAKPASPTARARASAICSCSAARSICSCTCFAISSALAAAAAWRAAHALPDAPPSVAGLVAFATLQKFPRVVARAAPAAAAGAPRGLIAVIVDEAHRSHGGDATRALERAVAACGAGRGADVIVGLSATPGAAALGLFGSRSAASGAGGGGGARATHVYAMRDAVADGVALHVLRDYHSCRPVLGFEPGAGGEHFVVKVRACTTEAPASAKAPAMRLKTPGWSGM